MSKITKSVGRAWAGAYIEWSLDIKTTTETQVVITGTGAPIEIDFVQKFFTIGTSCCSDCIGSSGRLKPISRLGFHELAGLRGRANIG